LNTHAEQKVHHTQNGKKVKQKKICALQRSTRDFIIVRIVAIRIKMVQQPLFELVMILTGIKMIDAGEIRRRIVMNVDNEITCGGSVSFGKVAMLFAAMRATALPLCLGMARQFTCVCSTH
jgi:hypothetical protein